MNTHTEHTTIRRRILTYDIAPQTETVSQNKARHACGVCMLVWQVYVMLWGGNCTKSVHQTPTGPTHAPNWE